MLVTWHLTIIRKDSNYTLSQTEATAVQLVFNGVEIKIEEIIGKGSYGIVYKAMCGPLSAANATIKLSGVNQPDLNLQLKFWQEIWFMMRINHHPNIVQFLGLATDIYSGRSGLLMELMNKSLTRFLERSTGPLPYHIQLNIGQDVAQALAYLHSNGIVHRDLSSNSVLIALEQRWLASGCLGW